MIGRRFVLLVLTVWLALPAGRLACAMSCAQPPAPSVTSSHCHEPATPSGGTAVAAGHACPALGSFDLAATLKARHVAHAVIAVPLPHAGLAGLDLSTSAQPVTTDSSRPPDRLLVPLRL